jgi:hypothetical protein
LSFRWYRSNDLLNVRHEAHVEHTVSLVEHQELNAREVHGITMNVIHETSRTSDDNAWISSQLCNLVSVRNATVNGHALNARSRRKRLDGVVYLLSELSGWSQDERARYSLLSSTKLLKEWKSEGGCLSGARLSERDQVVSLKCGRDRLALNRGWLLVA